MARQRFVRVRRVKRAQLHQVRNRRQIFAQPISDKVLVQPGSEVSHEPNVSGGSCNTSLRRGASVSRLELAAFAGASHRKDGSDSTKPHRNGDVELRLVAIPRFVRSEETLQ